MHTCARSLHVLVIFMSNNDANRDTGTRVFFNRAFKEINTTMHLKYNSIAIISGGLTVFIS